MVKLVKQGETGYGASPRMETDRRALQHRAELVEDPLNPARRCSTLRSVAIPATGAGSFSSVCADLHSKGNSSDLSGPAYLPVSSPEAGRYAGPERSEEDLGSFRYE